ncbi:MAG: NTP transferase domain-containing protein, partial [Armatimonadetes bacterium]|nr:NTP transferase domain-containing protein [Armatimonadota bacterium]
MERITKAVTLAAGRGTRMKGLTADRPKPMLPLGGRPLLEHIIGELRTAGIRQVNITTHYKGDLIEDYFRDGSKFGMDIRYVDEEKPLGT